MKKHDLSNYKPAVDTIPTPDGLEGRILARLAADVPQKRRPVGRIVAIAAIAATLIAAGGITVTALEVREYRTAVDFFATNALPTDALSRREIKAVYTDITSGSFALAQTGELLLREFDAPIEGCTITPTLLAQIWHSRSAAADDILPFRVEKSAYIIDYVYRMDAARGFEVVDYTIVARRDGVWTAKLSDFYIEDICETPHGLLVFGSTHTNASYENQYPRVALITPDGALIFDKQLARSAHSFRRDTLTAAIAEETRILLFGRGDLTTLTVTFLDYTGNQLDYTVTDLTGPYGIREVAKLGDGYLVRVANESLGERILRLDNAGQYTDHLTYTVNTDSLAGSLRITNTFEYQGKLYLSGYLYPTNAQVSRRGEIEHILEAILSRDTALPAGALPGLIEELRETYTAILLVCDSTSGEPSTYYSVEGAMGDTLSIDETGNLIWDTAHFATAIFSPMTSAFTIAAECDILRYTFTPDGRLQSEAATGRIISYAR